VHKLRIKSVGANYETEKRDFTFSKQLTLRKKVMFSDDEKRFMEWWELNRDKEKRTAKQWLVGLPLGLLFGIPILINFFSGWYTRASMIVNAQVASRTSNPVVLIIGVLLIISFIAIFSKRHTWEMNDQKYRELKSREKLTQE
jgi:hypothetical protein